MSKNDYLVRFFHSRLPYGKTELVSLQSPLPTASARELVRALVKGGVLPIGCRGSARHGREGIEVRPAGGDWRLIVIAQVQS
jgi:hypothetical protein